MLSGLLGIPELFILAFAVVPLVGVVLFWVILGWEIHTRDVIITTAVPVTGA